jgi:TusA-related sulfurtransferase
LPAAKTEVTPRADGVEVHVYAEDEATREQVRTAANLLVTTDRTELRKAVLVDADSPRPTSLATCPLLVAETRMELREAPDGVLVTLRVTRAEAQQEAMRTVVERAGRIESMRQQAPR